MSTAKLLTVRMEKALAKVKFEGLDAGGDTSASEFEDEGNSGSEEERETRLLVAKQNRKGKKSGGFQSMGLSHAVFKGIMRKGYRVPTPIQRKCIPVVMDGKDVVAMARTGSGKTAAFLVPMFEQLKAHSAKIGARALILSPTRELATQTMKFTKELGKFTDLRATLVLGGDKMEDQFTALHENPDIIIATPGRFLHLVVEMELRLSSMEYVVFDEADRLFEMGFSEQLREILRRLPEARQTLLFSATLPKLLVEFAKAGLKDPVLMRLDVDSKLSEQLKLSFLSIRSDNKPALLLCLLRHVIPSNEQTVIFTATKHHVEYLKELLSAAGINSTIIYSSLDQTARKINVAKFVNKKTMVMIVTDVAARGIDIPMLDNVINYNFPGKPKLFVHRVGRVARAGRSGTAYSLVSPDEVPYVLDLHLFLGRPLTTAGGKDTASGVLGSVPQSVIDNEEEFIRQVLSTSADLPGMKQVSENAQKHYVRSRPPPSPESVKRAKELPSTLPPHPVFQEHCSRQELEQTRLLGSLRSYRPSQTILEVHGTTRSSAKQIMRSKRDQHGSVVAATRQRAAGRETAGESGERELQVAQEESTEEDWRQFQTATRRGTKRTAKDENYIKYAPADMHSEKGLSLGTSFDHAVAGAVLDIEGDEGVALRQSKQLLKWDRKRKKFVNESGMEGQKKIKTESGSRIPASYKSSAYKEWMEKHKIEGPLVGKEGENSAMKKGQAPTMKAGRNFGKKGRKGRTVADLRTKSEILKKRQRKEFQETRRKLRLRKKSAAQTKGGSKVVWRFVAGLTGFRNIGWDIVVDKTCDRCIRPRLLQYLYETQDPILNGEVLGVEVVSFMVFNNFEQVDCFAVGYCMAHSQCTWNLDFIGSDLGPEQVEMLAQGLKDQPLRPGSINSLTLTGNPIHEGVAYLQKLPLEGINHLELNLCKLDGEDFNAIASFVLPRIVNTIRTLEISTNPVNGDALAQLLQVLLSAPNLHTLDIQYTNVGPSDIAALAQLIAPQTGCLRKLHIGGLFDTGGGDANSGDADSISMDDEAFGGYPDRTIREHVNLLLSTVFNNSSLLSLYLNRIDFISDMSQLVLLLESNSNLTHILFEGCELGGSRGYKLLARALAKNTALQSLQIVCFKEAIGREGALALSAALGIGGNRTLKKLELFEYTIGEHGIGRDGAVALVNTLNFNKTLQKLKLPSCYKKFLLLTAIDPRVVFVDCVRRMLWKRLCSGSGQHSNLT